MYIIWKYVHQRNTSAVLRWIINETESFCTFVAIYNLFEWQNIFRFYLNGDLILVRDVENFLLTTENTKQNFLGRKILYFVFRIKQYFLRNFFIVVQKSWHIFLSPILNEKLIFLLLTFNFQLLNTLFYSKSEKITMLIGKKLQNNNLQ